MSWQQFQFFETVPIRDPNLGTDEPLYSDPSLTAIAAVSNYIITSTKNSTLTLIDKDFKAVKSFKAYDKTWNITFIKYIPDTDFFATIAERQGQPSQLKVWDLNKIFNKELNKLNDSSYLTLVHLKNGTNSFPITSFTFSNAFNILGVGYANGVVVIVRGDLLRDRGSSQTVGYKSPDPITGLELVGKDNNQDPLLFVTTTSKVLFVSTVSTYHNGSETVLEKTKGADLGNVQLDEEKLLIGRDEGIVYYETNGNSYTVSLELKKKRIFRFNKFLLIVTSSTPSNSSLNLGGYSEPTKILIADTQHKLISFSYTIASTVVDVIDLWDDIYLLSSDGLLYKIHEKSIELKLQIVIKRDLYPIAIQIADNYVDASVVLDIKKQYGDYLYSKNETNEAMEQYISTLSLGKTTDIIIKYKDSKEVANLARYLEAILNEGSATKEHVTLLLCSYCKLKDVEKLNEFIKKYDEEGTDLIKVDLDLDIVVEMCRDSDFLEQAAKLAQNFGNSSLAINILLRDLNDATQALNYIKTLPVHDTLGILVEYARLLLEASPNVTTALLIDVFTGIYEPILKEVQYDTEVKSESEYPAIIQSYTSFLSYMSNTASSFTTGTGVDLDRTSQDNVISSVPNNRPTYQPPRPRIIFPSFTNNTNEFVIFLEAIAQSYGFSEANNDVLTTLFELYLTLGSQCEDADTKRDWEKKAIELAKSCEDKIDKNTVLLISNMFDFNEGQLLARDSELFEIDLFRSLVAAGDINGIFETLRKYGDAEPELYPLALMFYTSSEEIFRKVGIEKFKEVLDKIKKDRILSPLEIIQSLGVNKVTTIDLIKDYIIDFVETDKKEIEINQKLIQSYELEVIEKKQQVHKLDTKPTTIQATKCDSCSNKLEKETVHFLCNHSYHKYCLVEEDKCPKCSPNRETIKNIREAQRVIGERNDLFKSSLEDADSRFKVITDFFGKGAMERTNYKIEEELS